MNISSFFCPMPAVVASCSNDSVNSSRSVRFKSAFGSRRSLGNAQNASGLLSRSSNSFFLNVFRSDS